MSASPETTPYLPEARERELAEYAEWIADEHFPKGSIDPEELARLKSISVSRNDYGSAFDGLLEHRGGQFHIYCNTGLSRTVARTRFTVAHELGHFFIDEHREALRCGRVKAHGSFCDFRSKNPVEREADCFASNLLMPQARVTAKVRLTGFYSYEDGDDLATCLDGFSSTLLDMVPPGQRPRESQVDHFLAIIRKGGKATLYVNELNLVGQVRARRAFKSGEPVRKDDIADVQGVSFDGVDLPADAGIAFLVSVGWRKALFFDFMPLHPTEPQRRSISPSTLLAQVFTHLSFPDRLRITEEQWAELFRQRWFPFIGLSTDQLRAVLTHATLKAPIDSLLDDMVDAARGNCRNLRELVAAHSELRDHRQTLTKALEHFESGDYLSCASMLFPRIEGILRQLNSSTGATATQANLAAAAILDPGNHRHSMSLLFPDKFHEFLRTVYFADFKPANVTDVSRHTVAHGVAPEAKLTLKSAFMAVLTLEQIVRLMPPLTDDGSCVGNTPSST